MFLAPGDCVGDVQLKTCVSDLLSKSEQLPLPANYLPVTLGDN